METIFIYTENNKRNESHKFVLKFSQRLDLRSLNKYTARQTYVFITHVKIMRKQWIRTLN